MVLGFFSVRPNDLSVRILSLPGVTSHSVVMNINGGGRHLHMPLV